MEGARTSRPYMPGYGIVGPTEGGGLLPWSWADARLTKSHDYWLSTVWPDGRPHCMPVWGVWDGERLWFSCSVASRKARNLAAEPRCVMTTDDAQEPVVVEGSAEVVTDRETIAGFLARINEKYETDIGLDFLEPTRNATVRVRPRWVFALAEENFEGSPTRWIFGNEIP